MSESVAPCLAFYMRDQTYCLLSTASTLPTSAPEISLNTEQLTFYAISYCATHIEMTLSHCDDGEKNTNIAHIETDRLLQRNVSTTKSFPSFPLAGTFKIKAAVLISKVTLETSSSAHSEGPMADF